MNNKSNKNKIKVFFCVFFVGGVRFHHAHAIYTSFAISCPSLKLLPIIIIEIT